MKKVMRCGLFPIRVQSAKVGSVFEYARSVAHTGRPLDMAGFEPPFSGASPSRRCEAGITLFNVAISSLLLANLRTSLRRDLRIPFAADPDRGYSIFFRFPTAVDNMPGMADNITGTADKIAEFCFLPVCLLGYSRKRSIMIEKRILLVVPPLGGAA